MQYSLSSIASEFMIQKSTKCGQIHCFIESIRPNYLFLLKVISVLSQEMCTFPPKIIPTVPCGRQQQQWKWVTTAHVRTCVANSDVYARIWSFKSQMRVSRRESEHSELCSLIIAVELILLCCSLGALPVSIC